MSSIYSDVSPSKVCWFCDLPVYRMDTIPEIPEGMRFEDIESLPIVNVQSTLPKRCEGMIDIDSLPKAEQFGNCSGSGVHLAVDLGGRWDITNKVRLCGNTSRFVYVQSYSTGKFKRFNVNCTRLLVKEDLS